MNATRELIRRQLELEDEGRAIGTQRYQSRDLPWKTDGGSIEEEANLPPGRKLLKEIIAPVVAMIEEFLEAACSGKAGRRHAAADFLLLADPAEAAYLAGRVLINASTQHVTLQNTAIHVTESLVENLEFKAFREMNKVGYKGFMKAQEKRGYTRNTYGIRRGALYTWGSGTGSGKTTLMKQLMVTAMRPDLMEDHSCLVDPEDGKPFVIPGPRKVGCLFFEEQAKHTLKTLAGMVIGKRVHVPGTKYDKAAHRAAAESFRGLFFPIRIRTRSWDEVQSTIRYLVHGESIRDFFIDPMTALVATAEDERRALDGIMAELAGLAEELDITIHLVSHLSTPDGKSHEEGGKITEKHFRGSRSVAYWSHYMMGLERNKQDPACPTTVRGLKDRLTGDAVGPFIALRYDKDTGLMVEAPLPEDGKPFKDETDDDDTL